VLRPSTPLVGFGARPSRQPQVSSAERNCSRRSSGARLLRRRMEVTTLTTMFPAASSSTSPASPSFSSLLLVS